MNQSVKLQKKQAVDKSKRFEIDVLEGLKSYPKSLPSKYFYDDAGDRLFQKITTLNEYYLTRCEKEILHEQAADIANLISTSKQLRIIELGAGDGHKTIPFLKRLSDFGLNFDFVPVDISEDVLNQLASRFKETLPSGSVHPFAADYFNVDFPEHDGATLWMYMGSTIGNLPRDKAIGLLKNLHESAKEADIFALGYDLRKDPTTILAAYNDSHGITAAFNLNLLTRINRELGANFELANWKHYPIYDVVTGEARSYLVSQKKQAILFPNTNESIEFEPWEAIHTEISKKFSRIEMDEICTLAGWKPKTILTDNAQHYALSFYQFNP